MSNSLQPHELQHARPPCPSPTPGVHPKPMSIESMMPSNHLILFRPSPPALNPSQHQGLFQWFSSQHQVGQVLEFQLQHQSLVLDFKCCPLDFNDFLYCMFISLHFLSVIICILFAFHLPCPFIKTDADIYLRPFWFSLIWAFSHINFPLPIALAIYYKFWYAVFSLQFKKLLKNLLLFPLGSRGYLEVCYLPFNYVRFLKYLLQTSKLNSLQ